MKITEVEIYDVTINDKPPFTWNPIIIRINTDEGISGIGEVGLAYGVGSSAGAGMVRDFARRYLIGADPLRVEHIWETIYRNSFWAKGGGPVVFGGMSAIDIALWDIKGKAHNLPVYEMLGGRCHDDLWCYANGWYLGLGKPEDYGEHAKKVVADGFQAMKFDPYMQLPDGTRVTPPRALSREMADLAYDRVAAVREAVGPNVEILIEVHGNLGATAAIKSGKRMEELDPFFFEEPVDALNVDAMKKVADNVDIPIAGGERLYTRYGFRQYIEEQILDIMQPDMCLAGGISEVRKISNYGETYGLHVQPHNCASPISTAAAVQMDATIPNFIIQETFPYRVPENYNLVHEPLEFTIKNGRLPLPTKPGIGVELNDEEISKYPVVRVS